MGVWAVFILYLVLKGLFVFGDCRFVYLLIWDLLAGSLL